MLKMANWIRFSEFMPLPQDFPIWKYDREYDTLQLCNNQYELGLMPRQKYCKDDLFWMKIPVPEMPDG